MTDSHKTEIDQKPKVLQNSFNTAPRNNYFDLERGKLKNELEIVRKHFEIDSDKFKKSFEDDIKRLVESNNKFKSFQDKLENENKSLKGQLYSIQNVNCELETKLNELNKIYEINKIAIKSFDTQLNQYESNRHFLANNLNEYDKISETLLKNVSVVDEMNKNLDALNKKDQSLFELYENEKKSFKNAINKLLHEKNQQKAEFDRQLDENKLMIHELNHKMELKNNQINNLNDQINSLNDYKLKAQESIQSLTQLIDESNQTIQNSKQQYKELEIKNDELREKLNTTEKSFKIFEDEKHLEILTLKQNMRIQTEKLDYANMVQMDFEEKNESLYEQLGFKEFELNELKNQINEHEARKLNKRDGFTQTLKNSYFLFDKSTQTSMKSFDIYTQTNEKPILKTSSAVQCNIFTFKLDATTQTDVIASTTTNTVSNVNSNSNSTISILKSHNTNAATHALSTTTNENDDVKKMNSKFSENKNDLNSLLKKSFHNYTSRKAAIRKDTEHDNPEQIGVVTNKRVRFLETETMVEIKELNDCDYMCSNEDF